MKRTTIAIFCTTLLAVGCGPTDVKDKRVAPAGSTTSTGGGDDTNGGDPDDNNTAGTNNSGSNNAGSNNGTVTNHGSNGNNEHASLTLVIEPTDGLMLQEAGAPLALQVVLSARPVDSVIVPVVSADDTEVVAEPGSLTFTPGSWDVAQAVILRAIDDLRADGNDVTTVRFGPVDSGDDSIDGAETSVDITVIDGNCGNGVVDGTEACDDDSRTTTCDYGVENCSVCSAACELVPGDAGGFCGDGQTNGPESCDGPTEACPYGQMSCTTCSSCQQIAGQVTGYCGDGLLNGPEQCDGGECCTGACTQDPTCGAKCLMISEYVEGPQFDKAVEIYNCDTVPVNLERYELCMEYDASNGCSQWYDAQGTLQPGATRVVCNDQAGTGLRAYCDVYESHATTFNGDDRLFIYYDEDNDGAWSTADTVVDAFGELGYHPLGWPWEEIVWDRCNPQTFDGVGAWSAADYFALTHDCSLGTCDYTGLGVAPFFGCP